MRPRAVVAVTAPRSGLLLSFSPNRIDLQAGINASVPPQQRAAELDRHWSSIQDSLDVGCITTCQAEHPVRISQQRLDSGILCNRLYTILETLTIDNQVGWATYALCPLQHQPVVPVAPVLLPNFSEIRRCSVINIMQTLK